MPARATELGSKMVAVSSSFVLEPNKASLPWNASVAHTGATAPILELVKTRIPRRFGFDPIRDIQVLCPMNRGGVGARSLNIELQAPLNPAGDRKVERFGWTFAGAELSGIDFVRNSDRSTSPC
jgi:ATP-dependent exoDNAse (exonuclease V) alpha subunit